MDILMPARNAARTLPRAVVSVANQSSKQWRLQILVDPATKDNTMAVAQRLKRGIKGRILINKGRDAGLPAMYREIIDRAEPTDGICGFLDADDILYPDAIKQIIVAYRKHPECGCIWSQFHFLPQMAQGWSCGLPDGKSFKAAFSSAWWGAQHFRTFRKSVYERATFKIPLDIPYAVDHSLALCLASANPKGHFINAVLYGYFMGAGSISRHHREHQRRCYRLGLKRFKKHMRALKLAASRRTK